MTRKNAAAKRAARAVGLADGVPYSVARRREAERDRTVRWPLDIAPPRSIDELLHERVVRWCADQFGEPVAEAVWPDPDLVAELGFELDEPTVYELVAEAHMTESNPIEVFEGGTVISTVTAIARLTIDGLMDRAAAAGADGELVDVLTDQWNDHFSAVVARPALEVELEFSATTNPDYDGVEDFSFVSATMLGQEQR